MNDILKILHFVFNYKRHAFTSIFFNLLFAFFGLFSVTGIIPFLRILFNPDNLITELPDFSFNMNYFLTLLNYHLSSIVIERGAKMALLIICILIIFTTLLKVASRYFALFFLAPVRNGVIKDIRNKTFKKVLDLPLSYYSNERKGDIIARMSNDVQEIEISIISTFETIFKEPFIIILHIAVLFSLNPNLTLFVFILLPLSGYFIGRIGKTLRQTAIKGQRKLGILISIFEETISGLRILKAFNAEQKSYNRFFSVNSFYTRIMVKVFRRRSLAGPLSEFFGTIVMITIIWYGSKLVLKDSLTFEPANLIGYIVIFYMIINPTKAITTAYYNIQKGLASLDRVNKILNAKVTIKDKKGALPINEFIYCIEYRDVSFKYEKDNVLKNINLKIEKGKTVALVGQSGSGKSTMVDLLPRLIDVRMGDILIDNKSIKEFKIKDLRNLMGVVTQESILFNDSVFNNIAYGDENATEEQVIEAAKVANAHEFIVPMKLDYYTNIGDRGGKLSGGQRQRLSIARAVLKNPPILILDEATSSLDTESERLVQDALINLMKNRTSIVIAHRLSTVKNADEIIVLHEGEIVERGKHKELIKIKGYYKRLVDLQNFD